MAIRKLRFQGDEILTKECKELKNVSVRTKILIKDMFETMYDAYGVGLAAPQVGILRQVCVIDIGDEENRDPHVFINPVITYEEGEQTGDEGCLSLPGQYGAVTRPMKVKVRAYDIDMNEFELEAEGLLARAICHETDHLHGKMFTELVEGDLHGPEEPGEEEKEDDN